MVREPWKHLKSGTDIRGVALEGVEGQNVDLTPEIIGAIADAFLLWLGEKAGKDPSELTLAVGRDSRLSGPAIKAILLERFTRAGARVYDCDLASTPAMFMTTVDLHVDGSVQITASHHPWNRNGLKFFLPSGGLEGDDITALLEICQAEKRPAEKRGGMALPCAYMEDYAARLRRMIAKGVGVPETEKPLAGFRVAVDAGNGAGGFYAAKVLKPLGADTTGSQFLDPDGRFPNHVPNPENKDAMASACAAVKAAKADLGIIFDTDVDRAGCVDSDGREINRNRLVALASVIALADHPGGTIVTDSITSKGLKIFLEEKLGAKHLRYKRGYKNVINKALELNAAGVDSPLAIETSGHAALRENYFLDDGAYLATKILIEAAKLKKQGGNLKDLLKDLQEPAESDELRFAITDPDFKAAGEKVLKELEAYSREKGWSVADDSYEGVRVTLPEGEGNGFFLLRLSVHDPVMPLNVESDEKGGCRVIAKNLLGFLETQKALDVTPIREYLK